MHPMWESSCLCSPCNVGSRLPVLPFYTVAHQWDVTGRGTTSIMGRVAAGAGARFCQILVAHHIEFLMIKMRTQHSRSVKILIRKAEISQIFRDSPVTMFRDILFLMIFFPMYHRMLQFFSDDKVETPTNRVLLSGFLSGVVAILGTAFNIVKSSAHRWRSILSRPAVETNHRTFREIYEAHGLRGFYAGTIFRMIVISSLWFFIYLQNFFITLQYFQRFSSDPTILGDQKIPQSCVQSLYHTRCDIDTQFTCSFVVRCLFKFQNYSSISENLGCASKLQELPSRERHLGITVLQN